MSRFANKSLHLDIGCHQLSVSGSVAIPLAQPLKPGRIDAGVLDSLSAQLGDLFGEIGARTLTLSLSDLLARSWILERPAGVQTPADISALAALALQTIYGDSPESAAEWQVEVDALPFAEGWPAIALPKGLIERLSDIAGKHHMSLTTIQPRFVRALNQHAGSLLQLIKPARATLHILDTPDCITLGIQQAGQWRSLRTHPPLTALGIDQTTLIRRECRLFNLAVDHCRINLLPWPEQPEPALQQARS